MQASSAARAAAKTESQCAVMGLRDHGNRETQPGPKSLRVPSRNPHLNSAWLLLFPQGGRAQIKPAVVLYLKEKKHHYREADGVLFIRVR